MEIDEYDLIVDKKSAPRGRILRDIKVAINTEYNIYLTLFAHIYRLPPNSFSDLESEALQNCYSVNASRRDDLIARIIANQTEEFKAICAYCLLLPRETIDHYIPQQEYPAYSILVQNLIPCCSECNETKNDFWRSTRGRLFLHFYNDTIPNTQFLYGNLSFANNLPVISYTLQNNTNISPALFALIQEHFTRLHLLHRYSNYGTSTLLSEIRVDVRINRMTHGNIPISVIQSILRNKAIVYGDTYGLNYWKSIALHLLCRSNRFLSSL